MWDTLDSTLIAGTIRTRGLVLIEHEFQVPLDHAHPQGDRITVFAREVADPEGAAIYVNDMYVERQFSEETARAVRGLRTWVTDEYDHNGLRADKRVLDRLIDLARGRA